MTDAPDWQRITSRLIRETILVTMAWITPAAPVAGYLVGLTLGLPTEDTVWAVAYVLPPVFILGGILLPWWGIAWLLRSGVPPVPGEAPDRRLARLQRMPWQLASMGVQGPYLFGGIFFTTPVVIRFHKSPVLIGLGILIAIFFGVVLSVPVALRLEQKLMPYAIEERDRRAARASGSGFFWPRLTWYLPYVFATALTAVLILAGAVTALQMMGLRASLEKRVLADPTLSPQQAQVVNAWLETFSQELVIAAGPPLAVLGAFLLLVPTLAAWMLARRQKRAAAAVQQALDGLVEGRPLAPQWASTDEIGDLAAGMFSVLQRLKEIPVTLHSSAQRLMEAALALGSASSQQRQTLTQQAAALQETQVTSQEIHHTSQLAAQRAEAVLSVASRAEQLGRSGESAIEQTLEDLGAVRQHVGEIRDKVGMLQQSAAQINSISITVKSLADRSNMLALNAAIEAVRSGEHGKGFAVVAREIRNLADQSIRETGRIRTIIEDITESIQQVVVMSEQGAQQVEGGLQRARSSGDSLRGLALIVQENATAVRQISAAVGQQTAGVSQIFTAIAELSKGMDETVKRLDVTLEAMETLKSTTQEVTEVARRYQF